jgi:predicted amidohydrolase YtcJ
MSKNITITRNGMIAAIVAIIAVLVINRNDEPAVDPADSIYLNANIWTGDAATPSAAAMAIKDGRIVAIGNADQINAMLGAATEITDLGGRLVVPGFIDNHTHFLETSIGLSSVQLRDAATPEEFIRRIGDYAATLPAGRWIRVGSWDHENWGGALPRADWIDAVTPDNPVAIDRLDGHMVLANSLAMELAGISADTPDMLGGEIERDQDGTPNGVFKDTAMSLIYNVVPDLSAEELVSTLNNGIANALSFGVTQIHNMGTWVELGAFTGLARVNALKLRVYSFVPLADWPDMAAYVADNGRGDNMHRWGGMKGIVDGSLGSTTAWFYEPYSDEPGTAGFPLQELEPFYDAIKGADAAGLHVTVHAIGDQANDWLLDSFETIAAENPANPYRRWRIEHAQHLSGPALSRFAQLDVIPSMQPYHAIDDGRWAEKRIGAERLHGTYAFGSLLAAGARLSFGSDSPVAPMDVIAGIYAAVTRRTLDGANPDGWIPMEKISVAEALTAYTAANAYSGFQENEAGTLTVGKLADFVVLSDDLFTVAPEDIRHVKVDVTVIGGIVRYVREQ